MNPLRIRGRRRADEIGEAAESAACAAGRVVSCSGRYKICNSLHLVSYLLVFTVIDAIRGEIAERLFRISACGNCHLQPHMAISSE